MKLKDILFLLLGIAIQVATYCMTGGGTLSFVSGLFGAVAVVLCSQRRLSSYLFSFAQLGTYMVLAWRNNLYGEFVENIFYAVTMVIGVFIWIRNYDAERFEVKSETLGKVGWLLTLSLLVLGTFVLTLVLRETDDSLPFLDALTTIPAFIAQILLILRYREQWVYWLVVDLTTIVMWWRLGDWCMVSQYVFWTLNCVYGYIKWKE